MRSRCVFDSKSGKVMRSALALVAFIGASGTLGWMLLMPDSLRTEVEARTGFPFEAKTLACNPFGLTLTGYDLDVGNPGTFGSGDPMLEIESLEANASLPSLMGGEIWIYDLEIKVRRATLVVDEGGRLNLDVFMNRVFANRTSGNPMPFFAERVHLVVEELVMLDNSQIVPRNSAVRAMLDVEFFDLDSPVQIFGPIRNVAASVGSLPIK